MADMKQHATVSDKLRELLRLVAEVQLTMDFERPLMHDEAVELRTTIDAVLEEVDQRASTSPFLTAFRETVTVRTATQKLRNRDR
jgi:hypothetical protein